MYPAIKFFFNEKRRKGQGREVEGRGEAGRERKEKRKEKRRENDTKVTSVLYTLIEPEPEPLGLMYPFLK